MSTSSDESMDPEPTEEIGDSAVGSPGISDEQLPEDLQPTDDNPLAKPLDEDDEDPKLPGPGTDDVPGVEPGA